MSKDQFFTLSFCRTHKWQRSGYGKSNLNFFLIFTHRCQVSAIELANSSSVNTVRCLEVINIPEKGTENIGIVYLNRDLKLQRSISQMQQNKICFFMIIFADSVTLCNQNQNQFLYISDISFLFVSELLIQTGLPISKQITKQNYAVFAVELHILRIAFLKNSLLIYLKKYICFGNYTSCTNSTQFSRL